MNVGLSQEEIRSVLTTIGAHVVVERRDRTLLCGEVVRSTANSVDIFALGSKRRVRVMLQNVRSARVMLGFAYAAFRRICDLQRAGERYRLRDLGPMRVQRVHRHLPEVPRS